jgi:hypothetical protein
MHALARSESVIIDYFPLLAVLRETNHLRSEKVYGIARRPKSTDWWTHSALVKLVVPQQQISLGAPVSSGQGR